MALGVVLLDHLGVGDGLARKREGEALGDGVPGLAESIPLAPVAFEAVDVQSRGRA